MTMNSGTFSLELENPPVPGCTVSGEILPGVFIFSLAEGTDISPESYPVCKLWLAAQGEMVAIADRNQPFRAGELYVTPVDIPVGVQAETNSIYTEIQLRKETDMNPVIKDGEVFALKELVPYQERKIVNMDLVRDPKMKFVVMAFDGGTGLPEHAAPGEALIFALDGHGIIGYEGKEYPIKAGENFKFAKNSTHYIKADGRFKMALLLTLE